MPVIAWGGADTYPPSGLVISINHPEPDLTPLPLVPFAVPINILFARLRPLIRASFFKPLVLGGKVYILLSDSSWRKVSTRPEDETSGQQMGRLAPPPLLA